MNNGLMGGRLQRLLLLALCGVVRAAAQPQGDAVFLSTLAELREATYSEKASIVGRLAQGGHPGTRAVFVAMMDGRLYYRNNDQKIFIAKSADADPLLLIDPVTLKDAGSAPAGELTAIGTNNSLRRTLRITGARFGLSSADAAVRLEAVREMARS